MARNKIVGKNARPKSNLATGRVYKYDTKYQQSKARIKYRALLNKKNRELIKKGKAKIGDNKDVAHIQSFKKGGLKSFKRGLVLMSQSKNRAAK